MHANTNLFIVNTNVISSVISSSSVHYIRKSDNREIDITGEFILHFSYKSNLNFVPYIK